MPLTGIWVIGAKKQRKGWNLIKYAHKLCNIMANALTVASVIAYIKLPWAGKQRPRPKAQGPRPQASEQPTRSTHFAPSWLSHNYFQILNSAPKSMQPKVPTRWCCSHSSGLRTPDSRFSSPETLDGPSALLMQAPRGMG